jgi:hypothetical protein
MTRLFSTGQQYYNRFNLSQIDHQVSVITKLSDLYRRLATRCNLIEGCAVSESVDPR